MDKQKQEILEKFSVLIKDANSRMCKSQNHLEVKGLFLWVMADILRLANQLAELPDTQEPCEVCVKYADKLGFTVEGIPFNPQRCSFCGCKLEVENNV